MVIFKRGALFLCCIRCNPIPPQTSIQQLAHTCNVTTCCFGFICWILIYSFSSPAGNCLLHFSSFVQTYSNNFYLPYNVTSKSYSLVLKFRRSVRRRVVSFHFHPISLPITISLIKLTKIARRSFWKLSFESINHASGFR